MEKYRIVSLIFSVIIGVLILYISSLPFPPTHFGITYTSTIYHFGIFFLFALFISMSLNNRWRYAVFSFVFCFVYGVLDELHQYFVPGRCPSLIDIGLDSSGVFIGVLTAVFLLDFFRKS